MVAPTIETSVGQEDKRIEGEESAEETKDSHIGEKEKALLGRRHGTYSAPSFATGGPGTLGLTSLSLRRDFRRARTTHRDVARAWSRREMGTGNGDKVESRSRDEIEVCISTRTSSVNSRRLP